MKILSLYRLPSQVVQAYTGGEHVQHNGNKIIYGPFHSIMPETFDTLRVHYEFSKPLLTVTELVRDLQVSHWGGNLNVEENYKLHHSGAEYVFFLFHFLFPLSISFPIIYIRVYLMGH